MRWWILTLGLVACGGHPRPERLPKGPHALPRPQQPLPRDERLATIDQSLDLRWDELAITGENWTARVDTIPAHLRVLMATRLLSEGNFECETIAAAPGACVKARVVQRLPSDTSTLDDPCLRRQLALWALDQLEDENTILELHTELTQLITLPEPERELPAAAIAKMPAGYLKAEALWDAKAAGHAELITPDVLAELDADDLREAAKELHLDAAVLAFDAAKDSEIYVGAIEDEELEVSTRIEAMQRLVEVYPQGDFELHDDIYSALHWATRSTDCTIAAAATATLAELGSGKIELPSGPFRTTDEVISASCAALSMNVRGTPWKQVIAKRGVEVVNTTSDPYRVDALWTKYPFAYDDDADGAPDVPDADPDGDGDVATTRELRTAAWSKRFTLPYADELRLALPHCDGVDCRVPDSNVWFHLDIAKERGSRLRLRGIERHERVGSDC